MYILQPQYSYCRNNSNISRKKFPLFWNYKAHLYITRSKRKTTIREIRNYFDLNENENTTYEMCEMQPNSAQREICSIIYL